MTSLLIAGVVIAIVAAYLVAVIKQPNQQYQDHYGSDLSNEKGGKP